MGTPNAPQVLVLNVHGRSVATGEVMTTGVGIVCNGQMIYGIRDWNDEDDEDFSCADTRQIGQNLADALGVPLEEVSIQMADAFEASWVWDDALDLGIDAAKEQKEIPKMGM